jgi:hypothetical protein
MKKLLAAASLAFLAACGDHGAEVVVAVPTSHTTDLLVQATNHDVYDYALWLEWQDSTGAWQTTYLFSLYADPAEGPTTNFEILVASPEIPYTVLLADPDGTLWDTYTLSLPSGSFTDIHFQVIDAYLVR